MRRAHGVLTIFDPDPQRSLGQRNVVEIDTFTCNHCNRIVKVPPKCEPAEVGGLCYICAQPICPTCVGKGCDPFEEKLKRSEASYHARRSYGMG